jgi:uncharacterized membrane protein YidH (DUF202 family)
LFSAFTAQKHPTQPTGENMKNLINIAIVSLTLLISNYALANFQNGLNAYNKQDYAAALKEWITPRLYCAFACP